MAKHTVTSRTTRGGKPCVASETTIDEARTAKAAGREPLADVEPEDVF